MELPVVSGISGEAEKAMYSAPRESQPNLITTWTPPKEFLDWKVLPGAGLVMEAYYRYGAWDFRRYRLEDVRSSARFIEERVRDDIRCGKKRGIDLDGYSLNSHLTKPILMHMLNEHPEWSVMFERRDKQHSELPHEAMADEATETGLKG